MLFRNLLLIAGAVAILAGAAIAGVLLMSAGPVAHAQPGAHDLSVLVAARALPSGAVLQGGDLEWKRLRSGVAPPGSLSKAEISATQFVGSITRRDLAAGQIVTRDAVFDANDPKMLAAALSPGLRAVTIDVDAAQGGAGLILPDDRVDVILVSQTAGTSAGNPARASRAETLLRDVRVVAVDHAIQRSSGSALQSGLKGMEPAAAPKTIALEVTDRDARRLLLATQVGKIELALRSLARGSEPADDSTSATESDASTPESSPVTPRRTRIKRDGIDLSGSGSGGGAPIVILRGSKAAAQ
jgi:pilus assembly protein CpaB